MISVIVGSVFGLWALIKIAGAVETRDDPDATRKEKSEAVNDILGYGFFLLVALFIIAL